MSSAISRIFAGRKLKEQRNIVSACVCATTMENFRHYRIGRRSIFIRESCARLFIAEEARTESHYRGSRYLHNIKAQSETAKLVLSRPVRFSPAMKDDRRCRKSARAARHSWGSSRRQRNGFSPCKRSASRRTLVMGPRRFLTGLEARPTVTYTGPATC